MSDLTDRLKAEHELACTPELCDVAGFFTTLEEPGREQNERRVDAIMSRHARMYRSWPAVIALVEALDDIANGKPGRVVEAHKALIAKLEDKQ